MPPVDGSNIVDRKGFHIQARYGCLRPGVWTRQSCQDRRLSLLADTRPLRLRRIGDVSPAQIRDAVTVGVHRVVAHHRPLLPVPQKPNQSRRYGSRPREALRYAPPGRCVWNGLPGHDGVDGDYLDEPCSPRLPSRRSEPR